MSLLSSSLFLGGWFFFSFKSSFFLIIKTILFTFIFIILRAILPRYRFDQLMNLGWTVILPLSLIFLVINIMIVKYMIYSYFLNINTIFKYKL